MTPPSAEEQIQFLVRLQRILDEGLFTATYKFALLLALAQVSVEEGEDGGRPLRIPTRRLAAHFVRLYWRHVVPYLPADRGANARVLKQNTGQQAAILNRLARAHRAHGGSIPAVKRDRTAWNALLADVGRTIETMPLWKLQRVGRSELRFLYERGRDRHEIHLLPGVAYCFRRFQPLIQDLVQGAWTRFVRSVPENHDLVGGSHELAAFLFGSERASLAAFRPILGDLQGGRCFYCARPLGPAAEVDHFVPWSRYAVDLGHNLVLADAGCNARKRDSLAAYPHLERWCARNEEHGVELVDRFDEKGLLHDLDASWQVTRWAYGQAAHAGAQVWAGPGVLVGLDARWRTLRGMTAPASLR